MSALRLETSILRVFHYSFFIFQVERLAQSFEPRYASWLRETNDKLRMLFRFSVTNDLETISHIWELETFSSRELRNELRPIWTHFTFCRRTKTFQIVLRKSQTSKVYYEFLPNNWNLLFFEYQFANTNSRRAKLFCKSLRKISLDVPRVLISRLELAVSGRGRRELNRIAQDASFETPGCKVRRCLLVLSTCDAPCEGWRPLIARNCCSGLRGAALRICILRATRWGWDSRFEF